nr:uncharacterized protein LOC109169005 isoform X1 [Ipomoea batatas]
MLCSKVFKPSMSKLPEITSLFTALASKLRDVETRAENEDQNLDHAVGNLSRLLNLSETTPKVPVLDTALSLMCFTAPQVFDSMIEFMVKTIVTVLSSSVECEVVKCGSVEALQIGGSISGQDCVEMIEACADVLQKLEAFRVVAGDLSPSLLYAVVRVATLASRHHYSVQMAEMKATRKRNSAFAKLLCHSPRGFNFKSGEIPLRLLWWLLDPILLKNDITQMLQEATDRPFLCLEKEFYERTDWHSVLICLVLSPTMFIETRALLHNWFLLTGLASILELQTELVLRVLDVGSRPMCWGIPMEIALKLPFSHAYFPCENQLLRILAGPLSWDSFRHLVCEVIKPDCAGNQLNTASNQAAKASRVDHSSCWAMAINFPSWFFFASLLLFLDRSSKDNCYLKCISWLNKPEQSCGASVPYSAAAARFIAWVLNPKGDSCQDLLVEYLTTLSNMWTLEHCDSRKRIESTGCNKNKARRSLSVKRGNTNSSNFDCQTLQLWLKEVQDIHVRYSKKLNEHFALNEADHSQGVGYQKNILYRKIPLGILLGYSDRISSMESELLLHYAATGTLHTLKHIKYNDEWRRGQVTLTDKYTRKEAVAGASIAFHLTDATQSMSTSMFETEESGLNFLSEVKGKIGKYLLNCVKRLLQLNADEDYGQQTLRDLYLRMVQWKHQGQDICSSLEDWNDIVDALKCASASPC